MSFATITIGGFDGNQRIFGGSAAQWTQARAARAMLATSRVSPVVMRAVGRTSWGRRPFAGPAFVSPATRAMLAATAGSAGPAVMGPGGAVVSYGPANAPAGYYAGGGGGGGTSPAAEGPAWYDDVLPTDPVARRWAIGAAAIATLAAVGGIVVTLSRRRGRG